MLQSWKAAFKQPDIVDMVDPTVQMTGAHDALTISIHWRKSSFENKSWAEKSPQWRAAGVTPSRGHMEGEVGTPFPAPPAAAVMGMISCLLHACMHIPASQHTAMVCSACREKNYIPCLAQKGSTPLPGSFHSRQTINRVIFPALLRAVGREGQNLHHW